MTSVAATARVPHAHHDDRSFIRKYIFTTDHKIIGDRKSTRLNSSHSQISYAVFCLKKKKLRIAVTKGMRPAIAKGQADYVYVNKKPYSWTIHNCYLIEF